MLPHTILNGKGLNADEVMENFEYLMQQAGRFPLWAEESAALTASTFQWSFGNGSETPSGSGIVLADDCELYAVSAEVENGTGVKINVYKDTTIVADTGTFDESVFNTLATPVQFSAGDIVNFETNTVTTGDGGRVVAWFRGIN